MFMGWKWGGEEEGVDFLRSGVRLGQRRAK